jgi:hypothetical protein
MLEDDSYAASCAACLTTDDALAGCDANLGAIRCRMGRVGRADAEQGNTADVGDRQCAQRPWVPWIWLLTLSMIPTPLWSLDTATVMTKHSRLLIPSTWHSTRPILCHRAASRPRCIRLTLDAGQRHGQNAVQPWARDDATRPASRAPRTNSVVPLSHEQRHQSARHRGSSRLGLVPVMLLSANGDEEGDRDNQTNGQPQPQPQPPREPRLRATRSAREAMAETVTMATRIWLRRFAFTVLALAATPASPRSARTDSTKPARTRTQQRRS